MCGIVGFIAGRSVGKGNLSWSSQHSLLQQYMQQMLYLDAFRGPHATGMMRVERKAPKDSPTVYKRALHAYDYLFQPQAEKMLMGLDDAVCVVGHNRYATQGGTAPNKNAHPFQVDHITLVHNGHVTNGYHLLKWQTMHEVDSANVAIAIAQQGWENVVPRIEGAYTLVWHDAKEGTLNMVRNNDRPMFWAPLGDEKTPWSGIIFASEMEMLAFIARRVGIPVNDKFYYPPAHTLFKWSLEDPGKYTVHKFEAVKEDASSRPFPVGVVGGTTTTGRGGSGEYRGSKAERRAARKLETEAKLRYKQTLQFTCEGFSAYKNQQGEYGCLYGSAKTTGMANPIPLGVEISGVKRSTWEAYDQFRGGKGPIPIQAINVRTGATKRRVVVGSFLFDLEDWFSKRGDKSGGTTKEGTVVRTCRGPNGHLIPETFFNELVRQGCSHCGGNLDIDDAQSIVWGGEYGKSPICAPCTRQFMAESDKQQKGKMN